MSAEPAPSPADDILLALMRLFEGADTHHGTYNHLKVVAPEPGEKVDIRKTAKTLDGGPTEELWRRHLAGTCPLGVSPLRDNSTCLWGAVDYDDRRADHADLARRLQEAELPLPVCRSKSGGAHLLLFAAEPVPAKQMQAALAAVLDRLGLKAKEIFPKQTKATYGSNWLNMPYFGDGIRRCVRPDGRELSAEEFLMLAEASQQTADWVERLAAPETDEEAGGDAAAAPEAPPADAGDAKARLRQRCDQLAGAAEHDANNTLTVGAFDLARYCRHAGLDPDEAKAAMLKAWQYRKRGEAGAEAEFEDVWKRQYDAGHERGRPPRKFSPISLPDFERVWIAEDDDETTFRVQVDGRTMTLTSAQLLDQKKFNDRALVFVGRAFHILPARERNRWIDHVNDARCRAEPDTLSGGSGVSRADQFAELLEEFVLNRNRARTKDEILLGRPWEDEDTERHYFRLKDLTAFLGRSGAPAFAKVGRKELARRIRALGGGEDSNVWIQDRQVRTFWVPRIFAATPKVPLPLIQGDPI